MSNIGPPTEGPRRSIVSASHQNVYRELTRLEETNHFGQFYKTRTQRLDAALPFALVGLEQCERCVYVTDGTPREVVLDELSALDLDPNAALQDDQLRVIPQEEIASNGSVAVEDFYEQLERALEESRDDGFCGLRVVVEVPWEGRSLDFEEFVDYRTEADSAVPDGATILSQHDITALSEDEVIDIAQLYPTLIYRGRVSHNPFFDDPADLDERDPTSMTVEEVLDTAHDLSTAREAIRQREQRITVLNRVLRHNLRNEINVVQTHAGLIEDRTDDPEIRDSVETVRETTDRLLEIAEDARRVQEISSQDVPEREPIELQTAVERAAIRARNHHPSIEIDWRVNGEWIEGTDHLDVALTELFKRLAEAAENGCRISANHDPESGRPGHHCLLIECDGGGLPDAEIESLSNGIETQLTHSSGLGLWLVNWIVNLSGGRLLIEENGATVILCFPAADGAD